MMLIELNTNHFQYKHKKKMIKLSLLRLYGANTTEYIFKDCKTSTESIKL